MLDSLGHTMVTATDGVNALELLDENREIDLVISDLMMPRISGRELAQQLRDRLGTQLPVLYMTGYRREHADLEPDAQLLEKPFAVADLKYAIEKALSTTGGIGQ